MAETTWTFFASGAATTSIRYTPRQPFGGATRATQKAVAKEVESITSSVNAIVRGPVTRLLGTQTGVDGFNLRSINTSTGTESGDGKLVTIVDQDGVTWKFNVWSMT